MTDNMQFGTIDYGSDHHHKPTKAVIGLAIMLVLGFALYEFDGKSDASHSASTEASQTVASSNHQ